MGNYINGIVVSGVCEAYRCVIGLCDEIPFPLPASVIKNKLIQASSCILISEKIPCQKISPPVVSGNHALAVFTDNKHRAVPRFTAVVRIIPHPAVINTEIDTDKIAEITFERVYPFIAGAVGYKQLPILFRHMAGKIPVRILIQIPCFSRIGIKFSLFQSGKPAIIGRINRDPLPAIA